MMSQVVFTQPVNNPCGPWYPRQTPTGELKGTMVPKFCLYLALVSRQTPPKWPPKSTMVPMLCLTGCPPSFPNAALQGDSATSFSSPRDESIRS
jgi:hypothetical protein